LGVAVEIDADEAFASNDSLRHALFALYVLMALALIALGGSSRMYARAKTQIAHAKQLGQYTLVRELGRGGMGTVYEARHSLLRRPTAVKLMNVPATDPIVTAEALLRFEREVQLTSQLSHPNTVVIYDYGRTEEGVFYYAMEYIDGVDLDHLVRVDGPLPPGRVIHFAVQICGSLAEAHDKSLIHRDIKPANILVCERGGLPDSIKVLDFGLVKSLLGPQVSAAHVLVGTPQFMAPEVLREPTTANAQSDIYAVGAVLYWLATGHTIFDLERIIMRCLAREPLERPLSMSELAGELRACRAHGSWSAQDARRYWRERGSALVKEWPAAPDVPTLAAN
jgi:eukaryotic-like serine/threonine-protein kinase